MIFVATFYSHFGAIRYKKLCEAISLRAQLLPVPRSLSSSCGTCVQFEAAQPPAEHPPELEQIAAAEETGYRTVYRAENG